MVQVRFFLVYYLVDLSPPQTPRNKGPLVVWVVTAHCPEGLFTKATFA